MYVKELDLFVTVMLLEDTQAVLSFGKLCEDHRYNYHWTSGQKPHLVKNGRKIECNTANCVPFVVLGLSTSSSLTAPTSSSQEAVTPTEHPASTRSESMSEEVRGKLRRVVQQKQKTPKMMTTKKYEETRDLPQWLAEFREDLVDESVP